jgi:hypothetical protein
MVDDDVVVVVDATTWALTQLTTVINILINVFEVTIPWLSSKSSPDRIHNLSSWPAHTRTTSSTTTTTTINNNPCPVSRHGTCSASNATRPLHHLPPNVPPSYLPVPLSPIPNRDLALPPDRLIGNPSPLPSRGRLWLHRLCLTEEIGIEMGTSIYLSLPNPTPARSSEKTKENGRRKTNKVSAEESSRTLNVPTRSSVC